VEAEGYRASSNLAVDSVAEFQSEAATFKGTGSWSEYSVRLETAATLVLELRYRAAGQSGLKVSDDVSGASALVDMPATTDWIESKAEMRLEAGTHVLRLESAQGSLELDRVRATVK
jgi:hypothetical protein